LRTADRESTIDIYTPVATVIQTPVKTIIEP